MRNFKKKNPERGAAAVEFAILLPFLILFVMGMIELGLLFYNKQVLTNASREGARAGIARVDASNVSLTQTDIDDIIDEYCKQRLITFNSVLPDPSATTVGLGGSQGDPLTVTTVYDYTFLLPELLGFGTSLQLTSEAVMNMELILSSP